MWMVDTKLLCRKHLLGEHLECHMFVGTINKNISIKGYIENGLGEPDKLEIRHNQLAEEMIKRGYNRKSELHMYFECEQSGHVDIPGNITELARRCPDCRKLIDNQKH